MKRLLLIVMLCLVSYLHARVETVTNNRDLGDGSLRNAINQINSSTDSSNKIEFKISEKDCKVITPCTNLPPIIKPVDINGFSQPGSQIGKILLIELNGEHIKGRGKGLTFVKGSEGSRVEGLVIYRWKKAGIFVNGADNIKITNNYLGVDQQGTASIPNGSCILAKNCSLLDVFKNVIGGFKGVNIMNSQLPSIDDNYIGLDKTGTKRLDKCDIGIVIENCTSPTISGNFIAGQKSFGILANNILEGALFFSNFIGTDVSSFNLIENGNTGIKIESVNGMTLSGNSVAGWKKDGIIFKGTKSTIATNHIGLGGDLEKNFGNGQNGLVILGNDNLINGPNFIGGNKANGILIENCSGNEVNSNIIGQQIRDNQPTLSFGNGLSGIQIVHSPNNSIILNEIAGNGTDGVSVGKNDKDVESVNNALIINSIFANQDLGINIHLPPKGQKPGPNRSQSSPTITEATLLNSQIHVVGSLKSVPNTEFRIQFFLTPDNKPGQGKTFINFIAFTTDDQGRYNIDENIDVSLPKPVTGYLTAIATRITDDLATDTSEFSAPVQIR